MSDPIPEDDALVPLPKGAVLPEGYKEKDVQAMSLNKIVGKGYKDVWNCRKFYCIVRGGKGSKKTRTAALMLIWRIMHYDKSNALVVRKSYASLRDTVFTDLLWAIDRLRATDLWTVYTSSLKLEYKPTKQVILFRGLDKAEKLGGLTVRYGYLCWAWIDEFYEITSEDEFEKMIMGLRGYMPPEIGLWKQVICTFNPWSEHCWIKPRFFDTPHPDVFTKVTTYRVNEFLSDEDRARYEDLYQRSPRLARVICDGDWGIAEGLVYENWSVESFDPDEVRNRNGIHETYGLDFGYKVSYTAFVGALVDPVSRELWIFEDSIYGLGMTNLDIARRITDLGYADRRIVADRAEQKSIFELKAGMPCEEVGEGGAKRVVRYALPNIEPALKGNDSVANGIARLQTYKIYVHPACENVIAELASYHYEQDKDGNYTGKPAKEMDHCLVAGTMVLTERGQVPIEDVEVGENVLTHLGWKPVIASGITRPEPADIWRVTFEDGTVIEGTPDHKLASEGGFVSIESISPGDVFFKSSGACIRAVKVEDMHRQEIVYDLTVADAHTFFANAILSSNCVDALRYSMERFISKARGKVAEVKGGNPSGISVVSAGGIESPAPERRSRRVASSVPSRRRWLKYVLRQSRRPS